MYCKCPVCGEFMNDKMFCKKCKLQIDRVRRTAYFRDTDLKKTYRYEELDRTDWSKTNNVMLSSDLFGENRRFLLDGVVLDMFEERLQQILVMGASTGAVECPSKSSFGKYAFERWCLVNRTEPAESVKKLFQLFCSPTMEEKVNRVWRVFPSDPIDRHGVGAAYGFIASPISRGVAYAKTAEGQLKAFRDTVAPYFIGLVTKLQPVKPEHMEFYRDYYRSSASVVLNEFKSTLVADVGSYIQAPVKMSKQELDDLSYAKEVLVPVIENVVTPEYIKQYGVEAKRQVLERWGVSETAPEVIVIRFWTEFYKRWQSKELKVR